MEQLLGRQPKLSNKDSIKFFFLFLFLVILFVAVFFFFYCWDENSNSVLTSYVRIFRIK